LQTSFVKINQPIIMHDSKEFSHGLFAYLLSDAMEIHAALTASSRLLSFFTIQGVVEISSCCGLALADDMLFAKALSDEDNSMIAFQNRRDAFFLKVRHAIVFAETDNFMSMTMFTSGIISLLSQQIKYLTVLSKSDLSSVLSSGTPGEQARLTNAIQNGKLLISPRLPQDALAARLEV
jgi:hypothetical protein